MRQMKMMIVSVAFVSMVGLFPWRAISLDQAAANPVVQNEQAAVTPVVQGEQAQATPVTEDLLGQIFQSNAPTPTPGLNVHCFEVDPPCGQGNCTSLGTGYSCWGPDRCCCPTKGY